MRRRVVFVNRYFHPDHSATSQIGSDLAFHLASRGWEVVAITSRQRYDDPDAGLRSENVDGVRIVRVWSTRFGRGRLAGRAVDYATFYLSALIAITRHRRGAIVVPMTDPPMISVVAALVSKRTVNWLHDLFPEIAEALGFRVHPILRRLRDWSLRRARVNVVLGELMAARVPKAVVIHNWADAELVPIPREENPLRREWGLGERFVVGYSGNLGRVHEVETILGAMKRLQRLPEIDFLISGGGAKLEEVKREAGTLATFLPYQPRELLSRSLSAADAHLVSLLPSLEGLVVPSKFYGILAVGRPVIFVGADDGELARLIERHRCGVVVKAGDVDGLVAAIRGLAADRHGAAAMGRRGLEAYRTLYAPQHAFSAWERVLEEAAR